MEINKYLKELRTNKNITQEDLAEALGVSRQTISSWENGKSYPDIVSIIKISDLYNISLDKLLKEDKNLINSIDEKTNTVKSNKNIIFTLILGIIIFCGISAIRTFVDIPKIDNLIVNIALLIVFAIGTFFYLLKTLNLNKFLNKKTSNKTIVKTIIIIITVISLFGLFPLIDLFLDIEWQVFSARILVLLIVSIVCFWLLNKIDKL